MKRAFLVELAILVIEQLPQARQRALPFSDGIPGKKWVRSLYQRNNDVLKFSHPHVQEGKRYAATNPESLTTHFSSLEELCREFGFDSSRVWYLDETGATPGRDANELSKHRHFLRRNSVTDAKLAEFSYTSRVTVRELQSRAQRSIPVTEKQSAAEFIWSKI